MVGSNDVVTGPDTELVVCEGIVEVCICVVEDATSFVDVGEGTIVDDGSII